MSLDRALHLPLISLLAMATLPLQACHAETDMTSTSLSFADTPSPDRQPRGLWTVRSTNGAGECQLSINGQPSGTAFGLLVERCTIAALAKSERWRATPGGFETIDGEGRPVARFRMTGVDAFESLDGKLTAERTAMR